jgi:hypothetical protein
MAKLSGLTAPPKALQAYQRFMREAYATTIAPVVAEKWAAGSQARMEAGETSKEPKAAFRAEVAREVFKSLPSDQQKAYGDTAKKEAADAKAVYLKALKDPPPQDAESRQRYMTDLVRPLSIID